MAKLASIEFGRSDFKLRREDSNSAPAKNYNYSVWKDNKIDWSCAICALLGNKSVPVSVSLEWYDRTLWKCIFFYFTTNHHFLWKLIILTWLCFNVSIDNAGLRALFPPNNPSFLIIAKIKLFLRNSRHSSSPTASPPTSHPSWTSSTFFVLIGVCAHLSWHQLTVLTQKFQRDWRGHDDVLYYTYKATF